MMMLLKKTRSKMLKFGAIKECSMYENAPCMISTKSEDLVHGTDTT